MVNLGHFTRFRINGAVQCLSLRQAGHLAALSQDEYGFSAVNTALFFVYSDAHVNDWERFMANFDRRQLLGVSGAAALAPASLMSASPQAIAAAPKSPLASPLLNLERAYDEMDRNNVDALVCAAAPNVYYLTNFYPLLARMGIQHSTYAVLPRDRRQRPILITGHFTYYYIASDDEISQFADVHIFTAGADADAVGVFEQTPYPAQFPTLHQASPPQAKELHRRKETEAVTKAVSATAEQALMKVLKGLGTSLKRVAVDDRALGDILDQGGMSVELHNGENLIRSIRLQKSQTEVTLMRYAADANAQAGLAAAKSAREYASLSGVRAAYASECAKRGLSMEFMVVDKSSSPTFDASLEEGQAFLIDCVSHFHHYHGDYGRTIFMGEPTRAMAAATKGMASVWDTVRAQLKPGLRYSQISEMGAEAARKTGVDANIMCNPHSVGMFHTDEPSKSSLYTYEKEDLVLMENMILSIDCPMIDAGLGGSAHLEDLMLITKDGAEPLNDIGDQTILI